MHPTVAFAARPLLSSAVSFVENLQAKRVMSLLKLYHGSPLVFGEKSRFFTLVNNVHLDLASILDSFLSFFPKNMFILKSNI